MIKGALLLLLTQLLTAGSGVMLETRYRASPDAWREGLFYTVSLIRACT